MSLTFAHSEIAAATVGLLAIPAVIHWLSRRRYRQETWAAMAFLLAAQQRSRRRMRIEHWLLLALRTLIVAAVGMAIARPALSESALARAAGAARFDRVMVLDDTLSMRARRGDGRSAFDAARDAALRLLDGFGSADGVALVTIAGSGRALVDRPSIDHGLVRRLLVQIKCSYAAGDPAAAVGLAREALRRGDAPRDCQAAYVLTDAQATTWRSQARPVAGAFAALATPEFRYVVDVAGAVRPNAAVIALTPQTRWVAAGLPATFEARIGCYGMTPAPDAAVEWSADGKSIARVPLGEPGASGVRRVEFVHTFAKSGSHVVTARLRSPGDALPADDERCLAVEAAAEVPILIVSGESGTGPAGDAAFYLSLALSPGVSGGAAGRLFATRVVSEAELPSINLEEHRAIVLADIRRLGSPQWARLARYVRAGGGLLVCLGEHAEAAAYGGGPRSANSSQPSAIAARELLPVTLERAVVCGEGESGVQLRAEDWNHPVLADLAGHAGGGLLTTPIRGYVRAMRGEGGRVILSFTNGDPALVEQPLGRGRVMVWTSSVQMEWSALPAKPDFVPLMVNLAAYLASGDRAARNVSVGNPLSEPIARELAGVERLLRRPDGAAEPMSVVETPAEGDGAQALARYTRTDVPGIYALQGGAARRAFAVTCDAAESDLTSLDEAGLRRVLGGSFVYVNESDALLRRVAPAAPRREVSGALIGVLLGLVLVETLLAAWFGRHL